MAKLHESKEQLEELFHLKEDVRKFGYKQHDLRLRQAMYSYLAVLDKRSRPKQSWSKKENCSRRKPVMLGSLPVKRQRKSLFCVIKNMPISSKKSRAKNKKN